MKKYELENVMEPELFRETFSYEKVPAIELTGKTIPQNIPKDIWITDTTFRDGQQSRPPYTTDQIVEIFKLMSRLSGTRGLIRQSEFFLYGDKDREAVEKGR